MAELLAWLDQVPATSVAAFTAVAVAGLLMGVAPSSLPLVSVVVGCVAGRAEAAAAPSRAQGALFSLGFVLGLATVDAAIGALFGFLGSVVIQALTGSLMLVNLGLAALLIGMGLALLRIVRLPWPVLRARPREVHSFGGAWLLGLPFGLSTCPACTPMILPILGAAVASGTAWAGAALMFVFGLARGVPIVIAGAATGSLKQMRAGGPWVRRIERAGGVLLLLAAGYFAYQSAAYAGWVPSAQLLFG